MKLYFQSFLTLIGLLLSCYAIAGKITYNLPFYGPASSIFLPKENPNMLISVEEESGHVFLQEQGKEEVFDFGPSEIPASVSANGKFIAIFHEGTLKVWDIDLKSLILEKNIDSYDGSLRFVKQLSISPEGKFISVINSHHDAFLIDLQARLSFFKFKKYSNISSVSFPYFGTKQKQVALARNDGTVIFHDLSAKKTITSLPYDFESPISRFSWIGDIKLAIASFNRREIKIFSEPNHSPSIIRSTYGVTSNGYEVDLDAYNIAFSADGKNYLYLYQEQDDFGSFNDLILEYGCLNTLKKTKVKGLGINKYSKLSLSPKGNFLAITDYDGAKVFVKAMGEIRENLDH